MATVTPNQMQLLEGRKKEIWEMAVLMADDESPSEREIALTLAHAKEVIDGIDNVMKWVTGEAPRPNKKPLREWLQELQDEIDRGDFEYDEEED